MRLKKNQSFFTQTRQRDLTGAVSGKNLIKLHPELMEAIR
jgi:hypothetical protein